MLRIAFAICVFTGLLGAQVQRAWKSQAEYDLYTAAANQPDPKKKFDALNAWKDKYPDTDYKQERLGLYLQTYEKLGDVHRMVSTLDAMLVLEPQNLQVMKAMLLLILSPQYNDTNTATLELAVRVAQSALANLDRKPANAADAEWPKLRHDVEALSHTVAGWAAMNRKDNATAEQEFRTSLTIEPSTAQVDVWLGNVLRAQQIPPKIAEAFFFHARAAAYDGPGALPAPFRQQVDDYLHKTFNSFHGQDDAALSELKRLAASQPFPQAGFEVKTANQIAAEVEEETRRRNPQLALWMSLKKELTGPGGMQYFESGMKGAEVPGGASGIEAFKGTLIGVKPAIRPRELVVGIADPKTPEITLKLDSPLPGRPEIGVEIEFGGVPEAFAADPFMVTFSVERAKIKGLKIIKKQ